MANPKKRHSKCRRDKRRTHDSLTSVNYVKCPTCGEATLPHRMCSNCNTYNGRKIIVDKVEKSAS
jgi:large subunit ribosomal protein L32